ncbi:MAG: hypothetical protein QOF80_786 [Verrucomicrobiota bacterium]
MKPAGLLLLGLLVLSGCRAAHNVAVSSFRVLDAPANYVRKKINGNTETTTTTTTVSSDAVTTPGRTVTPSTASTQRTTTTQNPPRTTVKPSPSPKSSPATVTEKSKPSPSPSRTTTTQSVPTAKPVPGKPGYVFSPFDPSGGYVDVTGYTSGQKVKDPYSGKIFLVP